ncbi:v-type c subunit family protein [Diplodia corticola]|uniref:V-type c subunit family protein n=1 Tax=Diplodia corticola TaxID=236234 RepID=A0A1J9QXY6_9PEZI|nr:v-type c subunit family protein [Diplodia corticola]OJD33233.1 v-type c subunit family protein [Diplodia corticola]
MGTITVKKPGDTDIRTLIDRIEPSPSLDLNRAPTAMLLVTPSFASALLPPVPSAPASLPNVPEAVTQAVSRLVQDSLERESSINNVRIIAAVVDRLPSPEGGSQASKGREGLAYALWFNDNVARTAWSWNTVVQREDNAACLTIDFFDRFKLTDVEGSPRSPHSEVVHRLHLPLANTLFQTGHVSLMYNMLYRLSEIVEPKHGHGAILQNRRTLHVCEVNRANSQRVTWPVAGRYLAHRLVNFPRREETLHQLHVPLVPLTGPRQVEAGLGNIIRQVTGPDGKASPASHELEKAVSSFFEATGQAPHAMPVWALVCSEKNSKYLASAVLSALGKWQPKQFSKVYDYAGMCSHYVGDAWTADPKIFQPAIWKAMLTGNATLHRVLSGGGGWGKKAGLISLNPTTSAQRTAQQATTFSETDQATAESLKAVAEPGSYITFFTSPVSSLNVPAYEQDTSVFGTLPSSIDDIPDTATEGPSGIDVWPGYFGALSEQGMSFKFIRGDPHGPQGKQVYTSTMVDVPFSLFVTSNRLPTNIPAPAVRNTEGAMSKLQVEALGAYINMTVEELQRLPHIGPKITNKIIESGTMHTYTSADRGALHHAYERALHAARAEEWAVAQLPFRAPEVTKILEDMGNKSQLKCKKWEDILYPLAIRLRKRARRFRKLGATSLDHFNSMRQQKNTNDTQLTPSLNSIARQDAFGCVASRAGGSAGQAERLRTRFDKVTVTQQHRRRLSCSHRYTTNDSPSSSPSSSSLPPDDDTDADHIPDSLSSCFSHFIEDTGLDHRPDSPSPSLPAEKTNVDHTPDNVQLLFHRNQFRDTRQYFGRKRRVALQRLQDTVDNVATLRLNEIQYLGDAVELSDVVCLELMLECANANPAAWQQKLKQLSARAGPHASLQTDMWPAMWHFDRIDGSAAQDLIKKLRWRILRWGRKARIGDEEANRRLQKVMEMLQEDERGTRTFRMLKARLEELVEERMRAETRGWMKNKYRVALRKLRAGEIAYLREAVGAVERNVGVMGKILFFIKQGAEEGLERQKRVGEDVRQKSHDPTWKQMNEAWTLAGELESLLSKR